MRASLFENDVAARACIIAPRPLILPTPTLCRECARLVPLDALSTAPAPSALPNNTLSQRITYLHRSSVLSGAGCPQHILRSRQNKHAIGGFFFVTGSVLSGIGGRTEKGIFIENLVIIVDGGCDMEGSTAAASAVCASLFTPGNLGSITRGDSVLITSVVLTDETDGDAGMKGLALFGDQSDFQLSTGVTAPSSV